MRTRIMRVGGVVGEADGGAEGEADWEAEEGAGSNISSSSKQRPSNHCRPYVAAMATKHHPNLVRLLGYCIDMNPAPLLPFRPSLPPPPQVAAMATKHHPNLVRLLGYCIDMNPAPLLPFRPSLPPPPQVAAMATKHHPNLVRLLGYCTDMNPAAQGRGDLSMEQIVVYEFMSHGDCSGGWGRGRHSRCRWHSGSLFGILILTTMSGRNALKADENGYNFNVAKWAKALVAAGKAEELKDPQLDAPVGLILRLAQLALRCTATPTVSRPDMVQVVSELTALRKEFLGEVSSRMAERIDEEVESQRVGNFDAEIERIEKLANKNSTSSMRIR
ncbi:unnamed protein product [Closterium sp. Naga37s-1]|nr:unnamed protein product [Closterium sp. Naga37s-1]